VTYGTRLGGKYNGLFQLESSDLREAGVRPRRPGKQKKVAGGGTSLGMTLS